MRSVTRPPDPGECSRAVKPGECHTARVRGQSEPLAALIAVAVVCAAISLYVGTLSNVVGQSGSERTVAESSMDGIWRDVSEGGVYDRSTNIDAAVSPSSIPDGYAVAVEITVVAGDGTERTVASARFDDGAAAPPEGAQRVSRPVSVERTAGDVRPGRLAVEVWE